MRSTANAALEEPPPQAVWLGVIREAHGTETQSTVVICTSDFARVDHARATGWFTL